MIIEIIVLSKFSGINSQISVSLTVKTFRVMAFLRRCSGYDIPAALRVFHQRLLRHAARRGFVEDVVLLESQDGLDAVHRGRVPRTLERARGGGGGRRQALIHHHLGR